MKNAPVPWRLDPIVEELQKIRQEHARKFNYNINAIAEDIRQETKKYGIKTVSRSPRLLKNKKAE